VQEKQYQDLLNNKVDVLVGTNVPTSQINQEVKQFFATLRKKILDESVAREADRAAYTERLHALERRLADAEAAATAGPSGRGIT
jgi:hypothetical protein